MKAQEWDLRPCKYTKLSTDIQGEQALVCLSFPSVTKIRAHILRSDPLGHAEMSCSPSENMKTSSSLRKTWKLLAYTGKNP